MDLMHGKRMRIYNCIGQCECVCLLTTGLAPTLCPLVCLSARVCLDVLVTAVCACPVLLRAQVGRAFCAPPVVSLRFSSATLNFTVQLSSRHFRLLSTETCCSFLYFARARFRPLCFYIRSLCAPPLCQRSERASSEDCERKRESARSERAGQACT